MAKQFPGEKPESHLAVPRVPPEQPPAPAGELAPPPKFETPAPADPGGPVPRVIKPIERAPKGLTRYKIHCQNYAPPVRPWRYVLARNEAEARAHYLEVSGVKKEHDRVLKNRSPAGPQPEDPDLYVTTLPD